MQLWDRRLQTSFWFLPSFRERNTAARLGGVSCHIRTVSALLLPTPCRFSLTRNGRARYARAMMASSSLAVRQQQQQQQQFSEGECAPRRQGCYWDGYWGAEAGSVELSMGARKAVA